MREIKFRAWDREDKVMSELTQIHLGDHAPTISAWVPTYNDQTKMLVFGENADLMQFTGLKDRNGREIYEGDLIKGNAGIYEIRWDSIRARFFGHFLTEGTSYFLAMDAFVNHPVVGNIHENLDLVKS